MHVVKSSEALELAVCCSISVTPLDPPPHAEPFAMWFPLASILTQSPDVCAPVVVTYAVVFPLRVPTATALVPAPITGKSAPRS